MKFAVIFVARLVSWRRRLLHALSLKAQIQCSSQSRILWMMCSMRSRCQRQQLSLLLMNFRLCDCAATRETLQTPLRLEVHGFHIHCLLPTMKCLQSVVTGIVGVAFRMCNSLVHISLYMFACNMSDIVILLQ